MPQLTLAACFGKVAAKRSHVDLADDNGQENIPPDCALEPSHDNAHGIHAPKRQQRSRRARTIIESDSEDKAGENEHVAPVFTYPTTSSSSTITAGESKTTISTKQFNNVHPPSRPRQTIYSSSEGDDSEVEGTPTTKPSNTIDTNLMSSFRS